MGSVIKLTATLVGAVAAGALACSAAPAATVATKPSCAVPLKYKKVINTYYGKANVFHESCLACHGAGVKVIAQSFDAKSTPLAAATAQAKASYIGARAQKAGIA